MQYTIGNTSNNPTILYVEDNKDNRKLVSRVLNAEEFTVFRGANALEGFTILQTQTPDIILMDIHLPVIDGYNMTIQLWKEEQLKKVPIVAITANTTSDDEEKALTQVAMDLSKSLFT